MREFLDTLAVFEPLEFVVEVAHPNFGGFEAMAAFNVGAVASTYAAKCRDTNPKNLYRVRRLVRGRWLMYEGTT